MRFQKSLPCHQCFPWLLAAWWGLSWLPLVSTAGAADAAAAGTLGRPLLHLKNDGLIAGELRPHASGSALRWESPAFTAPFEFQLSAVSAVHFPAPEQLPTAEGEWCFELDQGTVLFGSLTSWQGDLLEVNSPKLGTVRIKASGLRRMFRTHDKGEVVYQGPQGLGGWKLTPETKIWREDFGHLAAEQEGTAQAPIPIPDRAAIELEFSWKKKPDFVLALAAGDDDNSLSEAFRFEVWGSNLVIQRELDNQADPAEIQSIGAGPGRAHLQVFLDQTQGRCLVYAPSGTQLAEIRVPAAKPAVRGGVRLENLRGDIRLERLRIVNWSGDLPREVKADQSRVHLTDGNIVYGQVAGLNPTTGEFVLRGESGETRLPADRIASVYHSLPAEAEPPTLRIAYHDGVLVGGELEAITAEAVRVKSAAITEVLRLPLAGMRSIIAARPSAETPDGDQEGPLGTLELDGVRLRGRLVDGQASEGTTCLVWQPLGSTGGSSLRTGFTGRIVYREPPPPKPAQNRPQAMGMRMLVINGAAVQQPAQRKTSTKGGQPSLYLRTGDTIPCEVTKIDESGVTFKTAVAESGFVPHAKIKAIELVRDTTNAPGLTAVKKNRLLTLPRMQRDNPPTHLIRSLNGDYLRARILSLDDQNLTVEVRLDKRTIPRDRIARIIWLHAEDQKKDLENEEPDAPPQSPDRRDGRVQVLRSDGTRITFVPDKFAEATLSGNSEVLGPCHVAMKQIDQLLIGSAIEQAAAQLAYQQWKLQQAADPKFVQSGDSGGGENAGTESPLVGQPAPPFELDLLKGGRFNLAALKGKVVVLDFWATWCGPCVAAMPQVDRAARSFSDAGVQLIAVNLEEAPKKIQAMLERHKLDVTVALDVDGAVAAKYQASAIPQTVIIDKDGVVSRVFVGGGANFEQQVRDSLQALLPDAKPVPAAE